MEEEARDRRKCGLRARNRERTQTHVFSNSKSRNICSVLSSPHPIIIGKVFPILGFTLAWGGLFGH